MQHLILQLSKIKQYRDKNRILKLALEEKRQRKHSHTTRLADLRNKNYERENRLPSFEQKVEQVENYTYAKYDECQKQKDAFKKIEIGLKQITKLRVHQLFKYIFPITKISPRM